MLDNLLAPTHLLILFGLVVVVLVVVLIVKGLIAIGTNHALRDEVRHLREENERLRSRGRDA